MLSIKNIIFTLSLIIATHSIICAQDFTPNSPVGEGKGIYPGRVTFIRDKNVSLWDGLTGHWWDEQNIDMEILNCMYDQSLCGLTGSKSVKEAWKRFSPTTTSQIPKEKRGTRREKQSPLK